MAGKADISTMERSKALNMIMAVLRIGFGLFFLYTGISKIASLEETAEFLSRCDVLPEWGSFPLACVGVSMELVVSICFLGKWLYRGATLMGTLMAGVFLGLFLQAWIRGLKLSCNCLGDLRPIDDYPWEVLVRALLLAGMLLLAWDSRRARGSLWESRTFDFSEI